MNRAAGRCIPLFLVSLTTACGSAPRQQETLGFKFPGDWDLKQPFQSGVKGKYDILEFVPVGQTHEDWTELVALQTFSGPAPGTPEEMMASLKEAMKNRSPHVMWNELERTSTSILYEWKLSDSPPHPDQHELARLIVGRWNWFRIAYTAKVRDIEPTKRKEMLGRLSEAKIRLKDLKE